MPQRVCIKTNKSHLSKNFALFNFILVKKALALFPNSIISHSRNWIYRNGVDNVGKLFEISNSFLFFLPILFSH